MICSKSRWIVSLVVSSLVVFLLVFPIFAQTDPDPNTPAPVLLGTSLTPRPSTLSRNRLSRSNIEPTQSAAFVPGSKIALFVSNLPALKENEANGFRVYAMDKDGRQYLFPVVEMQVFDAKNNIYALTVELRDELGYWDLPDPDSALQIQVTWRGMASNQIKLGDGKTGLIKNDPAAVASKEQPLISPLFKNQRSGGPGKNYLGYRWSGDRTRFLEQAAFGPTDALDARIRRIGIRTWLAEQFDLPYPSAANPYPDIPLKPSSAPADCDGDQTVTPDVPVTCSRDTYTMYPIQTWFYREAFYGDAQLRHRVSWALAQIWVISGVSTQQSSHMITYHKLLSKNAFGNWRQLMSDMTLNPGMGNYLDMIRSTKGNPNENYPREVLQLFNVGLFMLNPDGTVQCVEHNPCQAGDTPAPTYDQTTINNFTKVFTGWRDCIASLGSCPSTVLGTVDYKDPMVLNPNNHDLTAKTLFSYPGSTTTNIAACPAPCTTSVDRATYANNSLNQALDNIYNHPNVAPFVSKHLIQALVTSDPTPAYVGRISAIFDANRNNPTQMKEVIRAILLDPEARGDVKTDPHYGKLREPVQLATNLMRLFNVTGATGFPTSDGNLNSDIPALGENVFNSPTVFNFYPPDYVVPGTTLLGPEFAIFTTGTAIGRANLANRYVMGTGRGTSVPDFPNGTRIDLSDVIAFATADTTGNQMMDYLNTKMMHGTMSPEMRSTILPAVLAVASSDPTTRAKAAVYLIVTSSQYQVQR